MTLERATIVVGAVLCVSGAALVDIRAGLIVAGVLLILSALYLRGTP
jgi:hypothetical protein